MQTWSKNGTQVSRKRPNMPKNDPQMTRECQSRPKMHEARREEARVGPQPSLRCDEPALGTFSRSTGYGQPSDTPAETQNPHLNQSRSRNTPRKGTRWHNAGCAAGNTGPPAQLRKVDQSRRDGVPSVPAGDTDSRESPSLNSRPRLPSNCPTQLPAVHRSVWSVSSHHCSTR